MERTYRSSAAVATTVSITLVWLTACSSLQVSDAGRLGQGDWLTEGGTAARANTVDTGLTLPLREEWDYNAGGGFGPGGPLVAGENVYVYTRNGEVHAVSIEKGKKKGAEGFGESVNGTPAIGGTRIFVPSAWGSKHGVVAHNLDTGSKAWKYECPPVDEGVLLAGDLVIFSDAESTLHAVDYRSGAAVWKAAFDPASAISTTPVLAGGRTVVVADDRGNVHAVELQSGVKAWTKTLEAPVYSTPAVSGNTIVVGTSRGSLSGLDVADGSAVWTHRADNSMAKFASPAIRDGRVVVGASDGQLRAISLIDGSLEWTWHGDGAITAAPLMAGDQVFFGTMRKAVYALDVTNGHELWTAEVGGRVKSAATIYDGSIYFLSEPRHLHKFSPTDDAYANRE